MMMMMGLAKVRLRSPSFEDQVDGKDSFSDGESDQLSPEEKAYKVNSPSATEWEERTRHADFPFFVFKLATLDS